MTKPVLLLSFICLFTLAQAGGQQINADDLYTDGILNGRASKTLDGLGKTLFIQGVRGGIGLAGRAAKSAGIDSDEQFRKQLMKMMGGRTDDLTEQINDVYKDSANVRIPIPHALEYALRKIDGVSPRELEDHLAALRREFNQ
jgi:hypothetical protein